MRDITALAQSVFGGFILWYYVCALSFFAEIPQIILMTGGDGHSIKIVFTIYIVMLVLGMYQAATFNGVVIYYLFINYKNYFPCPNSTSAF